MVMVEVGDAQFAREMFAKVYDAMTHVVHDITEKEEDLFVSLHTQLSRGLTSTTQYSVVTDDEITAVARLETLEEAKQARKDRIAFRAAHDLPSMNLRIQMKTIFDVED